MKTILVPTDFSKNALNAIEYAAALAKKEKAKLILLNAYHYIPPASDLPPANDIIHVMRVESETGLRALCNEISKVKRIKCEYISQYNFAVTAIVDTAKAKKADMIIMGTKGASGIKEVLMGSNTASVIEKAHCPVVAVPEKSSFQGIKNILYAADYRSSDIDSLKQLADLAKLFNAKITVLHISDEEFNRYSEESYLQDFKDKVKKKILYDKIRYKLFFSGNITRQLETEIRRSSPDLLAMSTRHRNFMERIFGTSVTRKMAFHSKVPLIVFHHKKESVVFI